MGWLKKAFKAVTKPIKKVASSVLKNVFDDILGIDNAAALVDKPKVTTSATTLTDQPTAQLQTAEQLQTDNTDEKKKKTRTSKGKLKVPLASQPSTGLKV